MASIQHSATLAYGYIPPLTVPPSLLQSRQPSPTTNLRRPARSPSSEARIRVKNRRKLYLDLHPEYLSSQSLELADPLAYDRLVRRFQSAAEREAEGRRKGYSGVLEADLWRSEAKIDALAHPDHAASMRYRRDDCGEIVAEEKDDVPINKEDGVRRWRREMEMRFLRGDDVDFDYKMVDDGEQYDDRAIEEREEEERYFENEEPAWATAEGLNGSLDPEALTGQTGVQDY